jgi:hypothetical protein
MFRSNLLPPSSGLKMETSESSKILEPTYQTALRHVSEESYLSDLNIQNRKNLKIVRIMCIVSL